MVNAAPCFEICNNSLFPNAHLPLDFEDLKPKIKHAQKFVENSNENSMKQDRMKIQMKIGRKSKAHQ